MTLWGTVSAAQTTSELVAEPVDLSVDCGDSHTAKAVCVTDGIRSLYQKCQMYDVLLVAAGHRFPAHKAVLASLSASFRDSLRQAISELERPGEAESAVSAIDAVTPASSAAPSANSTESQQKDESQSRAVQSQEPKRHPELHLPKITYPEAVPALLDFVYGLSSTYNISSDGANADVLRLARQFDLPQLTELAARAFAQNLNSENAIERLATCEEFELGAMFRLIADALIADSKALLEVSGNMDILRYPEILQKLLVKSAARYMPPNETEENMSEQAPAKRQRTKVADTKPNCATGGA